MQEGYNNLLACWLWSAKASLSSSMERELSSVFASALPPGINLIHKARINGANLELWSNQIRNT